MTILDNPDNAAMAASGLLADITTQVRNWPERKHFFFGPWHSTYYRNRQYGIPFTSNCIALFYNKKMLADAGLSVPDSWGSLATAAQALSDSERHGFAISATRTEEGTFQFMPWLMSAGGSIRNIASPAAVKSVRFLRSLMEEGAMSPDVLYWTQEDVMRQFVAGKAAMMINGPWNIENIRRLAPDLDFGIAKLPRDSLWASVLGGENIVIMKEGKVNESWKFVSWLCSAERIDEYSSRTGYFPPRRDVARTSARWNSDPLLTVFMDQMQYAMPRGPHPRWPEISQILINAVQEGLSGTKQVEDSLKNAAIQLESFDLTQ
jgi:multiple sugar transport system substrate-binding protein